MTGNATNNNNTHHVMISNTLGSAFAGIVSRIFTHPIDTAKSRLQAQYVSGVSAAQYTGTKDVLTKTFRQEGIAGFYRGFGAILVGGTPGTVTYLCAYEMAKEHLGQLQKNLVGRDENSNSSGDFLVHFCAGMMAETIACIIYVPVDVIKERLQVQHASSNTNINDNQYRGSLDALKKIAKTEGLSGIYKGYAATLASFGPFSALYFMFYERAKRETRQYLFDDPAQPFHKTMLDKMEIPFPWLVLCSSSAGALASWLTSPLDMAKLRLQVQRGESYQKGNTASSLVAYRGVVDCLRTVYQDKGVKGLFRGAGARVCFYAPATTITMCCYETCRSFVAKTLLGD